MTPRLRVIWRGDTGDRACLLAHDKLDISASILQLLFLTIYETRMPQPRLISMSSDWRVSWMDIFQQHGEAGLPMDPLPFLDSLAVINHPLIAPPGYKLWATEPGIFLLLLRKWATAHGIHILEGSGFPRRDTWENLQQKPRSYMMVPPQWSVHRSLLPAKKRWKRKTRLRSDYCLDQCNYSMIWQLLRSHLQCSISTVVCWESMDFIF